VVHVGHVLWGVRADDSTNTEVAETQHLAAEQGHRMDRTADPGKNAKVDPGAGKDESFGESPRQGRSNTAVIYQSSNLFLVLTRVACVLARLTAATAVKPNNV
jgi:hypothetical protein